LSVATISVIAILALTGVVVGAASRIDQDTRRHGEELVAIGEEVIATSSLGIATQNMQPLHWQRSLLLCGW
jgi:hypothetical protein